MILQGEKGFGVLVLCVSHGSDNSCVILVSTRVGNLWGGHREERDFSFLIWECCSKAQWQTDSLFLWWNIPLEFCGERGLMSAPQLSKVCAPRRKGGSGTCICCEKHMQLNLACTSRFYLFWRLWDTSNLGWKRAWEDISLFLFGLLHLYLLFPSPKEKKLLNRRQIISLPTLVS